MGRLAAILIVALVPLSAFGDTHYVSKAGSNTPPYTSWDDATDSVKLAIEAASPWDTVRVGPGTFVEDSIETKTGMVLSGAGRDSTTLELARFDSVLTQFVLMGDSSVIEGFFLKGKSNQNDKGVAFRFGNGGKVMNNRIRSFSTGVHASRISSKDTGNVIEIAGNSIEVVGFRAIEATGGRTIIRGNRIYPQYNGPAVYCSGRTSIEQNIIGGIPPGLSSSEQVRLYGTSESQVLHESIELYFCTEFEVRNNLIWGGNTGLWINNEGTYLPGVPWGLVENNTVHGVLRHGIGVNRNNVLVRNNIVSSAGELAAAVISTLDSVEFEYNLIWNYTYPPDWDSSLTKESVFADPMFVDTIEFFLQAFSPAIDAGDPTILDLDGSRSDIGYTGGPGGFTYAHQDLPPAVPHGLTATPTDSQIALLWRFNHEVDFSHYDLYRDTVSIVSTDPALLLATVVDSVYTDTAITPGETYYYRLTATDNQANTSAMSEELALLAAGVGDVGGITPTAFTLFPNYPNPFNAQTTVRYALDRPGWVTLAIYDVLGRKVETLVDAVQPAGRHSVSWGATRYGSGVYFIVLEGSGNRQVRKALLLK